MKLWVNNHTVWVAGLITVTMFVGVVCELIVLKDEKMGQVYFIIIGLECVLVAAFARLALNESYSLTELAGLLLIVAGVAVFQLPEILKDDPASKPQTESTTPTIQPVSTPQIPMRKGKSNRASTAL